MGILPVLGNNIFCIEGDWEEDLRKKISILSALEMLSSISNIDYIYKTCATTGELIHRLNDYSQKSKKPRSVYKKYNIIYIATHGTKGSLDLNESVDVLNFFTDSSNFAEGLFENKIIHFGSCSTLRMKEHHLGELKDYTKAKIVTGYTKDVDFLQSTLFEVLYFDLCTKTKRRHDLESKLAKKYSSFRDDLGFVMV